MDPDIKARLDAQDAKLERIWISVEKTRRYFLVSMWTTIILFVLPVIGLIVVIPMFLHSYVDLLGSF